MDRRLDIEENNVNPEHELVTSMTCLVLIVRSKHTRPRLVQRYPVSSGSQELSQGLFWDSCMNSTRNRFLKVLVNHGFRITHSRAASDSQSD